MVVGMAALARVCRESSIRQRKAFSEGWGWEGGRRRAPRIRLPKVGLVFYAIFSFACAYMPAPP